VAVPHLTGWDDLEKTLLLLEAKGARTIRLFLPGTTRFAPDLQQWDEMLWLDIAAFRQRMRGRMSCPFMLEPPLKKDLQARVEGIIRGTAAQRAGLQAGDRIDAVDGEQVCSAAGAFDRIKKAANPVLTVERPAGGFAYATVPLQIVLEKEKGASTGLVMDYDLAEETMAAVQQEITRLSAGLPLLLTSRAAAPLWACAAASGLIPPGPVSMPCPTAFSGGRSAVRACLPYRTCANTWELCRKGKNPICCLSLPLLLTSEARICEGKVAGNFSMHSPACPLLLYPDRRRLRTGARKSRRAKVAPDSSSVRRGGGICTQKASQARAALSSQST